MASLPRLCSGLLVLCPLACEDPGPPPEPEPTELVELTAWERVADPADDVFGAERPADLVCDEVLGVIIELLGGEPVLEIDTDFCNYATVEQPSLRTLRPGDRIAISVWHYDLTAPEPTQAHLALAIDGELVWEQHLPVPTAPALIEDELEIDREIPAGAPLQFHVHNHGANTYDLVSLEVVDDEATPP
ncbi:hypothetical protein [Paraliomyxa miuraensis]|uniref:hypothetical protein n=1 Tax=Paraliomyxa miuraensis TaxID=376150 RepID=UPI00224CCF1F|nr:hypothetical protein [Paraliomyxa miuraensis]MCX4241360.1 hypothetical protein [Paraliomyxa miuraensis]